MKLFQCTGIPLLGRALDAYALRQKVLASNLANISTPAYKRKEVSFQVELAGAMSHEMIAGARTHEGHLPVGVSTESEARIVEAETHGIAVNGVNNVDIDQEMAELAVNQLRFKFAARMLADAFKGIQKSIRGQV
jgi:flagellar basal-body rod protein FlgB